jgi:uncharacterized membrane protein HdeD (DUF308 family)
LLVGFSAMGSPYLYSLALARFLGIFALVSGFISLPLALFGKDTRHRALEALLALVRIAAGVTLLFCLKSSVVVITFILSIFLIVEGVLLTGTSLRMRNTPGWFWTMLSGIASLVLGVMVYNRWPSDSAAVLGLFLGLHLVMNGASLLALGLAGPGTAGSSPVAA